MVYSLLYRKEKLNMLFAEIMSFRDLAVAIIGELSPAMSFMYDIVAVIFAFLFLMVIYSFFVFFKKLTRWWSNERDIIVVI